MTSALAFPIAFIARQSVPLFTSRRAFFTSAMTAAMLFQSACALANGSAVSAPAQSAQLEGIWQSDGYGYVLDLSSSDLKLYHVTETTCVRSKTSAEMLGHYIGQGALQIDANGQSGTFTPTLEEYPIHVSRVQAIPATCNTLTANDPFGNFDAFSAYFAQHYAFFDLYGVDWPARVAAARAKVTANTSDTALFAILSGLLEPVKDGHVSLSAKLDGRDEKFSANPSIVSQHLTEQAKAKGIPRKALNDQLLEEFWLKGIGGDILRGKGKMAGNNRIQYGMLDDDIAYINVLAVADFAGKGFGHEADDLAVLNTILDKAFTRFEKRNAKALIVDLSLNVGGYDFISRAIASRFAEKGTLIHRKRATDSSISQPFEQMIAPHTGKRFAAPIYVLTSNATISGGEVLTLALRALPQVTHAGQPTRGAFSDVLEKEMPNGWSVTLSNEEYTDPEGNNWEGCGITPQMPLTVFETDNLIDNHRKAVEQLRQAARSRLTASQQPG